MLKYRARMPLKSGIRRKTLADVFRGWAHSRNETAGSPIEEIQLDNTYAARFVRKDKFGAIWKTDIIYNEDTGITNVSLYKSYQQGNQQQQRFRAPRIVEILYQYGVTDNGIPTSIDPVQLSDMSTKAIKDLISGSTDFVMPSVYISTANGTMATDPGHIAEALKGIAHVIISFNPEEDHTLFKETGSRFIPVGGKVSVFFPGEKYPYVYAPRAYTDIHSFERDLIKVIGMHSIQMEYQGIETWEDVLREQSRHMREEKNAAETQQAEELRKQLSAATSDDKELKSELVKLKAENADLEQMIDTEISRLQASLDERNAQYEKLQLENFSLKKEIDACKARSMGTRQPIICRGTEQDYYENEAREVVLEALQNRYGELGNCREKDVLEDILSNNPSGGNRGDLHETIYAILKDYKVMSPKTEHALNAIGIQVRHGSAHYKLTLKDDERYVVTMSVTPSDKNAGKVAARQINTAFF